MRLRVCLRSSVLTAFPGDYSMMSRDVMLSESWKRDSDLFFECVG